MKNKIYRRFSLADEMDFRDLLKHREKEKKRIEEEERERPELKPVCNETISSPCVSRVVACLEFILISYRFRLRLNS